MRSPTRLEEASMHYSFAIPIGRPVAIALQRHAGRRAEADLRWPALTRILSALHRRGRRSIRIVDTSCGAGDLLVQAARRARDLGFVAIEGRGVDADPMLVGRARATARSANDPAIGLVFEVGDAADALREEADFPADLVLCSAEDADAARGAGRTVLRAPKGGRK
jgi:SAM-dependent methyltransferase